MALIHTIDAFQTAHGRAGFTSLSSQKTRLFSSTENVVLSLSLEKPLGMILEEVEEGQPKGVLISDLADEGSASCSEFKDSLVGLQVARVMGEDVTNVSFDGVMDKLINAPSPVSLDLVSVSATESPDTEPKYEVGTPVAITVLENGKEIVLDAKVGDNLRRTLLENNVEVYKGLKKKLGNCGGGGQCGFCAAEFIASDGWEERSDYEDQKLKKSPNARLTCLNNIVGPATIQFE